jgi:predicted 3-demethylubiquinone-9 3-methyltransferase (glyoxalase superfamily)
LGLVALNGGAISPFTPAISFFVNCQTSQEVDVLWNNLSDDGKIFMDLDKYPFNEKFGLLSDKYGTSWQISLANNTLKIMPFLLFVGDQ